MLRYLSPLVLGIAGLGLAMPQVSDAQTPVGVQVQVGPGRFIYQSGYSYAAPACVVPAPVVTASPVVVTTPVPYRTGYRVYRHGHWDHHNVHYHHR